MSDPRTPFGQILALAASQGAGSVLFLVGRPPVFRVNGALQPPLPEPPLSFHDTAAMVDSLVDGTRLTMLHTDDSIEMPFQIGGVEGTVTIFYGQGAHNLVFHIGVRGE